MKCNLKSENISLNVPILAQINTSNLKIITKIVSTYNIADENIKVMQETVFHVAPQDELIHRSAN